MTDCSKCQRTDVKCCSTCKKDADKCKVWHCCGSDCREHESRIPTNADRIRAMSDEELAEFLDNNFCHRYCCGEREKQATLDWLRSEVEQ